MHMQTTVMGWHVYDLSRLAGRSIPESAFLLGVIGLVRFVPLLVFSMYGGSIADRFSQRHIIMFCLMARFCVTTGLVTVVVLAQHMAIAAIMVVAFFSGLISSFQPAANVTLLSRLVDRPGLPNAVAKIALGVQTAVVTGPFLGGVLFAVSAWVAYLACATCFLVSMVLVYFVRYQRVASHEGSEDAKSPSSVLEGLRYVWRTKLLLGAISLDFVVGLLAGAVVLLPAIARDVLLLGPSEMGMLRSSMAVGGVATALTLSRLPIRRFLGRWMFGATLVYGLSTIAFGLSTSVMVAAVSLAVVGASDIISVFVRQTLLQLVPPDDVRGRVAALVFVSRASALELGNFESGVVARILGPVNAIVVGGVAALAASGIWMARFPSLRRRDTFES